MFNENIIKKSYKRILTEPSHFNRKHVHKQINFHNTQDGIIPDSTNIPRIGAIKYFNVTQIFRCHVFA